MAIARRMAEQQTAPLASRGSVHAGATEIRPHRTHGSAADLTCVARRLPPPCNARVWVITDQAAAGRPSSVQPVGRYATRVPPVVGGSRGFYARRPIDRPSQ